MTTAFTSQATIDRPAPEVWAALVNWDNAQHWMEGIEWLRADGPVEAGTTLTFRARGKDRPSMIAKVDPGSLLVLRSEQGGVTADYHYRVRPIDATTSEVELTADCSTRGLVSLVGPLLRAAIRRSDSGQPANLKRLVEAGPLE